MDESALRRKALESMLKKREGKDGAKGESEAAEDGEVLSPSDGDAKPPSGVVKKSKWADDDEGGGSDALSHRPPEGVCVPVLAACALHSCCFCRTRAKAVFVVFFPPDACAAV